MGENSNNVFNFGCPSIDVIKNENLEISNKIMKKYFGVGIETDWEKEF